ncbi:NAC domain-containing 83-like [Olea europaea subsp. europaea]|uniref:NAC domain-containing 83-like n=1 Tax=Olea europaea subsp. europaea TaxID=158383 RepID=A0A8S0QXW1_OLEEU|nr:NAC domain-containing 83-like [Olea europaea subsp. europaea]
MAFSIPPCYRFKSTEQELITLFLEPKAMGFPLTCDRIIDRNLYGENRAPWNVFSDNDPWEIVGDSEVDVLKKEIYVFTKLEKNRRSLIVRVAGCGTWDGKSLPKEIKNCENKIIGFKKSFTFKVTGNLTRDELNKKHGHWIMHEYTLNISPSEVVGNTDYAVCRISCVKEESRPTEMSDIESPSLMEEMTGNQALHDQELNSEPDLSRPTEMSDIEFPSLIEEMTWNQALHDLDLSRPTEMSDIEFPSLIEEMTRNQALHDQEQNSEANLPLPEMTREEGLRCIEEYFTFPDNLYV